MQVGVSSSSVRPGLKDPLDVQATILFSSTSSDVSGSGLWRLAMYGSKNGDGSGPQFQRVHQTLSSSQQAQSPQNGRIDFVDAYGELDMTAIGCGEYTFLCFDFTKGDNPSTDFTFASLQGADSNTFTVCTRRQCSQPGGLLIF